MPATTTKPEKEMYDDDDVEDDVLLEDDAADEEFNPNGHYTAAELEEWGDKLLRADSNRELCRKCKEKDRTGKLLPYGEETGMVESVPQFNPDGSPMLDDEDTQLYLDFPELKCEKGHRWFQGEGQRRDIRGPNPILFESHLYNRKRREIYVEAGTPDPAFTMDRKGRPTQGMYNRCVDQETRALTPTGWRTYDRLAVGDAIWSYDLESDSFSWQPIEDMYTSDFDGQLHVLESQNISARVTEGHRWPVVHEEDKTALHEVMTSAHRDRTKRDPRTGQMMKAEQSTLLDRHYIRLPTPSPRLSNRTQMDLFELLGWVLSDGTYLKENKAGCIIYQALHNPKVVQLRNCLVKNKLPTDPQFVDQNNVGRWAIPAAVGHRLRAIASEKLVASVPLDQYSWEDYDALLRGIMYGDGYLKYQEIYSTKRTEADAIQALATIVGKPTSKRLVENPAAICPIEYVVHLKQSHWAYVRPARQAMEDYQGIVWCPTVATGFWVAERNGKVYATGNSHPEGRKINTKSQRAKNGASYYRGLFPPMILTMYHPLFLSISHAIMSAWHLFPI